MEIDRRQYIEAEYSPVPEHRPFVVTDLAISVAHRRTLEQTALNERARKALGFGEDNLILNLGAWESAQAIIIQRSIIDGENIDADEISLILTAVDWRSLLDKSGKPMSDSEFDEAKAFVTSLLPGIIKITESYRENPGYHLEIDRNLDAAITFAMQRGVTILDVFRDDALYSEFGRDQLSPEKIESSVNVIFEDPDQLKKMIDDYLVAKIREIFGEQADEEIEAFMVSPEYKLMMLKLKFDFPKAKQLYIDFYMGRFFGYNAPSVVEE